MPRKPPRSLPTAALALLWLALYVLWLSVRPEPAAVTQRPQPAATTSTTARPLFQFKP